MFQQRCENGVAGVGVGPGRDQAEVLGKQVQRIPVVVADVIALGAVEQQPGKRAVSAAAGQGCDDERRFPLPSSVAYRFPLRPCRRLALSNRAASVIAGVSLPVTRRRTSARPSSSVTYSGVMDCFMATVLPW